MEAAYWFVGALLVASLVFFGVGRWLHSRESGLASRLVVYNHVIQGVDCLFVAAQTVAPGAAVAEGFYMVGVLLFAAIPLTWFLFSLAYAYPEGLTRGVEAAIGGYFALLVVLAASNPFLGGLATEVSYVVEPFPHVVVEPSALGTLGFVSYFVFLAGVVLLVYRLVTTMRASRGQLAALVVGLLFPSVYVPVVTLGALPATAPGSFTGASLGYMLVGSTWPSALVAWAVYRYQLFDVVPLARESIFEDREEPVLVLDADRRLIDYNRAAVEVFPSVAGNTGASLVDVAPELVATDGDGGGGGAGSDPSAATGDEVDFADSVTRYTDSGPREYAVGVSRLSTDEGVQGYALVVRDVTEREQYVRDLEQQTAQLERFASTLSHDLRNPLNVAQGRVQQAIESGSTVQLEAAVAAHERIQVMIEDLLTLAREGQTIDETEPVSLAEVARRAWETTDTPAATLQVGDDAHVVVYADDGRLQTVFENLFRNAVTHGGPSVTVTLGRHPDGFYVEDDGPGVPPGDREAVFEFEFTTDEEGTGLGLAIVDAVARAHGWDVEMSAGTGGGARVVFSGVDVVERAAVDREPAPISDAEPATEGPAQSPR